MILTLRRFLLVFLVLLQMIAPLVHAHSGGDFSRFGIHLPTFEIYGVADYQNSPTFQSLDYLSSFDDAIVSISAGIQNEPNNADDLSSLLYFPPLPFIFSPVLSSCEINFSPQAKLCFKPLHHSPHSPRAPPV